MNCVENNYCIYFVPRIFHVFRKGKLELIEVKLEQRMGNKKVSFPSCTFRYSFSSLQEIKWCCH